MITYALPTFDRTIETEHEDGSNWSQRSLTLSGPNSKGLYELRDVHMTNSIFSSDWDKTHYTRNKGKAAEADRLMRVMEGDVAAIATMSKPEMAPIVSIDDVLFVFCV